MSTHRLNRSLIALATALALVVLTNSPAVASVVRTYEITAGNVHLEAGLFEIDFPLGEDVPSPCIPTVENPSPTTSTVTVDVDPDDSGTVPAATELLDLGFAHIWVYTDLPIDNKPGWYKIVLSIYPESLLNTGVYVPIGTDWGDLKQDATIVADIYYAGTILVDDNPSGPPREVTPEILEEPEFEPTDDCPPKEGTKCQALLVYNQEFSSNHLEGTYSGATGVAVLSSTAPGFLFVSECAPGNVQLGMAIDNALVELQDITFERTP